MDAAHGLVTTSATDASVGSGFSLLTGSAPVLALHVQLSCRGGDTVLRRGFDPFIVKHLMEAVMCCACARDVLGLCASVEAMQHHGPVLHGHVA